MCDSPFYSTPSPLSWPGVNKLDDRRPSHVLFGWKIYKSSPRHCAEKADLGNVLAMAKPRSCLGPATEQWGGLVPGGQRVPISPFYVLHDEKRPVQYVMYNDMATLTTSLLSYDPSGVMRRFGTTATQPYSPSRTHSRSPFNSPSRHSSNSFICLISESASPSSSPFPFSALSSCSTMSHCVAKYHTPTR